MAGERSKAESVPAAQATRRKTAWTAGIRPKPTNATLLTGSARIGDVEAGSCGAGCSAQRSSGSGRHRRGQNLKRGVRQTCYPQTLGVGMTGHRPGRRVSVENDPWRRREGGHGSGVEAQRQKSGMSQREPSGVEGRAGTRRCRARLNRQAGSGPKPIGAAAPRINSAPVANRRGVRWRLSNGPLTAENATANL